MSNYDYEIIDDGMIQAELYGSYRNMKFTDIYPTRDIFMDGDINLPVNPGDTVGFNTCGLPMEMSTKAAETLYLLLYARYGNSTIASSDIHRFQYQLFAIIFEHGPVWEKKLQMQTNLRKLTDEELRLGNQQIFNHSMNPSTPPATDSYEALDTVNDQTVSSLKKSKMEAYTYLNDILDVNITTWFLDKFRTLFLTVVEPERPLLYSVEEEENGSNI